MIELSGWRLTAMGLIIFWVFMDIIILLINIAKRSGPGGCNDIGRVDGGWIWYPGIINRYLDDPCVGGTTGDCTDLGKWKKYSIRKDAKALCASEVDKVWKEAIEKNVVSGYNVTELLAYVIVPTITLLGIVYGFLSTNMNKSEWTFWIMIATIMATGITSITYDTDLSILPTDQNPLELVTSKLSLGTADELEFSFISRKQDGDECLIKGTVYGETAAKVDGEPVTYTGDCTSKDFL